MTIPPSALHPAHDRRSPRTRAAAALAVAAAIVLGLLAWAPTASAAPPGGGTVRGVDVSGHQHKRGKSVDFAAMRKAGYAFAFVKATEGRGFVNATGAGDGRAAQKAGLVTGFYHYAHPGTSASRQAQHFVSQVKRSGVRYPLLVLDLEIDNGRSPAHVRSWALSWLSQVERATGVRPIVYTYGLFWNKKVAHDPRFAGYPLWVAHYETKTPRIPAPWSAYTIWQYTMSGRVPGIAGKADVNVAPAGYIRALAARAVPPSERPAPAPAPTQTTPPQTSRSGDRTAPAAAPRPSAPRSADPRAEAPTADRSRASSLPLGGALVSGGGHVLPGFGTPR